MSGRSDITNVFFVRCMGDMVTEAQRAGFFRRIGDLMEQESLFDEKTDVADSLVAAAQEAGVPEHIIRQAEQECLRTPARTSASLLEEQLAHAYVIWEREGIKGGATTHYYNPPSCYTALTYHAILKRNTLSVCVTGSVLAGSVNIASDLAQMYDWRLFDVRVSPECQGLLRKRTGNYTVRVEPRETPFTSSIAEYFASHVQSGDYSSELRAVVRTAFKQLIPSLAAIRAANFSL